MNLLESIPSEAATRVCLTLAHSLWQFGMLALLAWLVARWLKRSSQQYLVHVAALLTGLLLLPATFAVIDVPSLASDAIDFEEVVGIDEASPGSIEEAQSVYPAKPAGEFASAEQVEFETRAPFQDSPPEESMAKPGNPKADATRLRQLAKVAPWLLCVYLLGVLAMLARLLKAFWSAERLAKCGETIGEGQLQAFLTRLSSQWQLRVVPVLKQTESVVVPKVVGLLKPTILLPTGALTGLTQQELEMIVAHEMAHVRRADLWVNLVQRLAETVLFFNPALWFLSRRISTLREYCCDELACEAVSQRTSRPQLQYALALLQVVELKQGADFARTEQVAALATSGCSPSELRRRIARLFGEQVSEPLPLGRGGVWTLLVLGALLVTGPLVWAERGEEETKEGEEAAVALKVGAAKPPAEEAANEKPKEANAQWEKTLLELRAHNPTAFSAGPQMLKQLDPEEAWQTVRKVWPRIKSNDVKTGLLKTFEFRRHPRVLDVLDLGARDESKAVREYAYSYLQNYSLRDFADKEHDYKAWRAKYGKLPKEQLLQKNARWFVDQWRDSKPPQDLIARMHWQSKLNIDGTKSSYPSKARYLLEAGLIDLLKSWRDDPQAPESTKQFAQEWIVRLNRAALAGDQSHKSANLKGQELADLQLGKGADQLLSGADLSGSDMKGARFVGGVKSFYETNFSRADLTSAVLLGTAAGQKANFAVAKLKHAVLDGGVSGFQIASFDKADLTAARLSGSFQLASFVGANLTDVRFEGIGGALQSANFDNATLLRASINCSGAAFQATSLNNTDFSAADLSAIDHRSLASCKFDKKTPPRYTTSTKFPRGFDPKGQGWLLMAEYVGTAKPQAENDSHVIRDDHFFLAPVTTEVQRRLMKPFSDASVRLEVDATQLFDQAGELDPASDLLSDIRESLLEMSATTKQGQLIAALDFGTLKSSDTHRLAEKLVDKLAEKAGYAEVKVWSRYSNEEEHQWHGLAEGNDQQKEKVLRVGDLEILPIHTPLSRWLSGGVHYYFTLNKAYTPEATEIFDREAIAAIKQEVKKAEQGELTKAKIAISLVELEGEYETPLVPQAKQNAELHLGAVHLLHDLGFDEVTVAVEVGGNHVMSRYKQAEEKPQSPSSDVEDHFIILPVTTPLQRCLLGEPADPKESASFCVFVNANKVTEQELQNKKSEFFSEFSTQLAERARYFNGIVRIQVVDDGSGKPFKEMQPWLGKLADACEQRALAVGFSSVKSSRVFGATIFQRWAESTAAQELNDKKQQTLQEEAVGDDLVNVYMVRTLLSRLLTNATCVVEVKPVLKHRDIDGFPVTLLASLGEFVPKATEEIEGGEPNGAMQLRIRLPRNVNRMSKAYLDAWAEDQAGRKAFANQFGYDDCYLNTSYTGEVDETVGEDGEVKPPAAEPKGSSEPVKAKPSHLEVRPARVLLDQDEIKVARNNNDPKLFRLRPKRVDGEWILLADESSIFTERDIAKAKALKSEYGKHWDVQINLKPEAAKRMKARTTELLAGGRDPNLRLAVLLDSKLLMAPTLNSTLGERVQISSGFDEQEARALVEKLRPPAAKTQAADASTLPVLTVKVVDKDGKPVQGATVHAQDRDRPFMTDPTRNGKFASGTTDQQGEFVFDGYLQKYQERAVCRTDVRPVRPMAWSGSRFLFNPTSRERIGEDPLVDYQWDKQAGVTVTFTVRQAMPVTFEVAHA